MNALKSHNLISGMLRRFANRLLFLLVMATVLDGGGAKALSVDEIIQAWRVRESSIRTLSADFAEVESFSESHRAGRASIDLRRSVLIDGVKMRHEISGDRWNDASGMFVQSDYVSVFDKIDSKSFHSEDKRGKASLNDVYRKGYIYPEKYNQDYDNVNLKPLLMYCRPLSANFKTFRTEKWELLESTESIDGRECAIIVTEGYGKPKAGLNEKAWVDVARQSIVLQYDVRSGNEVIMRTEVGYVTASDAEYVPNSWQVSVYSGQTLTRSSVVENCIFLLNTKIEDGKFAFDFPVGTKVLDRRNDKEWVVRDDGTNRTVTQAEQGVDYELLLTTESGKATPSEKASILMIANIIIVAILAIAIAIRVIRSVRSNRVAS